MRNNWAFFSGAVALETGRNPRRFSLEMILNAAYVMLIKSCEDEEEIRKLDEAINHREVTLTTVVESTRIEGDEGPEVTMVPSWWKGEDDAEVEAVGFQDFVRRTQGDGRRSS